MLAPGKDVLGKWDTSHNPFPLRMAHLTVQVHAKDLMLEEHKPPKWPVHADCTLLGALQRRCHGRLEY